MDDELSTPIMHSDDDEGTNRRTFNDDELDAGGSGGCCCNPASTCHRFIALILMCLVGFGNLHLFIFKKRNLKKLDFLLTFHCNSQLLISVMTILGRCKTILSEIWK